MRLRSPLWPFALLLIAGCGKPGIVFPPSGSDWPAPPVPDWTSKTRIVIPDIGDDTLAFVSMDLPAPRLYGLEPVGDIPIEIEGPHDVAVAPDGSSLYAVMSNAAAGTGGGPHGAHGNGTVPGSLIKLNARDLSHQGEAQIDRNAAEIVLDADGTHAYVSHYDLARLQRQVTLGLPESEGLSTVAVVETRTMTRTALIPVCPTAHDLELSEDGKTLYVTCSMSDELALVDTTTHAVKRVPVGPAGPVKDLKYNYFPYAVLLSPADGSLWISCNTTGDMRVFDPKTGAMDPSRHVFLNGVPMFGAFLSDGKTLVMPHQGDDKISIIDTAQGKEVGTPISLPEAACYQIRNTLVLDDDRTAYFTCEGDHVKRRGTLVAVDLNARTVLGWVEVGLFPDAISMMPPAP